MKIKKVVKVTVMYICVAMLLMTSIPVQAAGIDALPNSDEVSEEFNPAPGKVDNSNQPASPDSSATQDKVDDSTGQSVKPSNSNPGQDKGSEQASNSGQEPRVDDQAELPDMGAGMAAETIVRKMGAATFYDNSNAKIYIWNDNTATSEDPFLGRKRTSSLVFAAGSIYRVYNPTSGEHFYTKNVSEKDSLVGLGWNYESRMTGAPGVYDTGALPVYRLYNPNSGLHHYTMSRNEGVALENAGWNYEGVAFYAYEPATSSGATSYYRLYNPNNGQHHYTTSAEERDYLSSIGWTAEGTAWKI